MHYLQASQDCPECGERLESFRKNKSLNYIFEVYEESGERKDRPPEECKEIEERLKTEKILIKFEYENGDIYEGEWRKGRIDGSGKMEFIGGDLYEGEWKNDMMDGRGKNIYHNGNVYEGE